MLKPSPHVTLGAALKKAISTPAVRRHIRAAEVFEDWETFVGPAVANHVQPESFEKGILTLRADSSVWRQQVILMKPQLLDRISGKLKTHKVRELRVK